MTSVWSDETWAEFCQGKTKATLPLHSSRKGEALKVKRWAQKARATSRPKAKPKRTVLTVPRRHSRKSADIRPKSKKSLIEILEKEHFHFESALRIAMLVPQLYSDCCRANVLEQIHVVNYKTSGCHSRAPEIYVCMNVCMFVVCGRLSVGFRSD